MAKQSVIKSVAKLGYEVGLAELFSSSGMFPWARKVRVTAPRFPTAVVVSKGRLVIVRHTAVARGRKAWALGGDNKARQQKNFLVKKDIGIQMENKKTDLKRPRDGLGMKCLERF
jgi:hypothetical protein